MDIGGVGREAMVEISYVALVLLFAIAVAVVYELVSFVVDAVDEFICTRSIARSVAQRRHLRLRFVPRHFTARLSR